MRPTSLKWPAPAMPATSVAKISGAMTILIRRRKIWLKTLTAGAMSGLYQLIRMPATTPRKRPRKIFWDCDKPRAVKDLQYVRHDAAGAAAAADPLPPPFSSNVAGGSNARVAFLIVDNETISTGRETRVRDGLAAYINAMGPGDVASIQTVP